MKRDFTEASKNELLSLVDQVESEKFCDVIDWIGDRFLDLRSLVGELSLDNYLNNMSEYHKLVIDKNNTTREQIEKVFTNVYAVDSQYAARFAACKARLDQLTLLIGELAQVISPDNGGIGIDARRLDRAFNDYDQLEIYLSGLAPTGEGLTYADLDAMSEEARSRLSQCLIGTITGVLPNSSLGNEVKIPLGPDITFYYKADTSIDTSSDFDLEAAYKDGKVEIENFGYTVSSGDAVKIGGSVSNDGLSISASSDHADVSTDNDGVSYSSVWKNDAYTYYYTDGISIGDAAFFTEVTVETEFDEGSVSSTAGIKAGDDEGWKWEPVYAPVTEPAWESISLPSIDVPDWVYVTVPVAIALIGLALIPATGGTSAVLCAV